jgi:hypothetical protein
MGLRLDSKSIYLRHRSIWRFLFVVTTIVADEASHGEHSSIAISSRRVWGFSRLAWFTSDNDLCVKVTDDPTYYKVKWMYEVWLSFPRMACTVKRGRILH